MGLQVFGKKIRHSLCNTLLLIFKTWWTCAASLWGPSLLDLSLTVFGPSDAGRTRFQSLNPQ